MSNEPTVKRLLAQSPAAPADAANSDAGKMLAALGRMATALHGGPDAIERLRAELGGMADVVAQLRLAMDAELDCDLGALLRDLEARTGRLIELVTPPTEAPEAAPVPEPQARPDDEQAFLDAMAVDVVTAAHAEPDRVPTVSDVVSNLGRASDVEAGHATGQAAGGNEQTTTVAMLEAMVEKLASAMPAAPPQSEVERKPAETAAAPVMPDIELLNSFARMTAMPYLPPEVGTAVIFEAKAKPETTKPETTTPEATTVEAAPPDPPPTAAAEPQADHSVVGEPILVMPPLDAVEAETEPEPSLETSPPAETPPEAEAVPLETPPDAEPVPGDVDLDALLFEPPAEPEPDPAAFLLEPAPWPTHAAPAQTAEPSPEPEPEPEPPTSWAVELPSPASVAAAERPVFLAGTGQDPLAPLKAMSAEEKIALFE
jgi:hypothetical protein